MNTRLLTVVSLALGLALPLLFGPSVYTAESYLDDSGIFNQPGMVRSGDALPEDDGIQTLTRGPVHEAFAEPVSGEPKPTPVVAKEAPKDVNETTPAEKPETPGVQWLPGYWAWDDDRNDYLWVSGIWRVPPPDREWVPGHWNKVDAGWQRVPGFWKATSEEDTQVLPTPPAPLAEDEGVPPSDAHVWVPGTWVHQGDSGYQWRGGFYVEQQPGWVYVPAHYVWTLAGFVFVEGYWDLALRDRGLLFCPVAIDTRAAARPDFVYQPRYVVHDQCLLGALFVRSEHHSYYFGDYFSKENRKQGYVSWIDHRVNQRFSDPLFSYYRHQYRDDRKWERELRDLYSARRRGEVKPPPRTLVEQNRLVQDLRKVDVRSNVVKHSIVAAPVKKVDPKVVRVQTLDAAKQAQFRKNAEQFRAAGQQREKAVSQLIKTAPKGNTRPQPLKLNLPKVQTPKEPVVRNRPAPRLPTLPKATSQLPGRTVKNGPPKPEGTLRTNNNGAPGKVVNQTPRVDPKPIPKPGNGLGKGNGPAPLPGRSVGQTPERKTVDPKLGNRTNGNIPPVPRNGQPLPKNQNGQNPPVVRNSNKPPQTPPVNRNGQNPPVARNGQPLPNNRLGQNPPVARNGQAPPVNRNPEPRLGNRTTPDPRLSRPATPQQTPRIGQVQQTPRNIPPVPRVQQTPRVLQPQRPPVTQVPRNVPQTPRVQQAPVQPRVNLQPRVNAQPRLSPATPAPRLSSTPRIQSSQPFPSGRQTFQQPSFSRPAPRPSNPSVSRPRGR